MREKLKKVYRYLLSKEYVAKSHVTSQIQCINIQQEIEACLKGDHKKKTRALLKLMKNENVLVFKSKDIDESNIALPENLYSLREETIGCDKFKVLIFEPKLFSIVKNNLNNPINLMRELLQREDAPEYVESRLAHEFGVEYESKCMYTLQNAYGERIGTNPISRMIRCVTTDTQKTESIMDGRVLPGVCALTRDTFEIDDDGQIASYPVKHFSDLVSKIHDVTQNSLKYESLDEQINARFSHVESETGTIDISNINKNDFHVLLGVMSSARCFDIIGSGSKQRLLQMQLCNSLQVILRMMDRRITQDDICDIASHAFRGDSRDTRCVAENNPNEKYANDICTMLWMRFGERICVQPEDIGTPEDNGKIKLSDVRAIIDIHERNHAQVYQALIKLIDERIPNLRIQDHQITHALRKDDELQDAVKRSCKIYELIMLQNGYTEAKSSHKPNAIKRLARKSSTVLPVLYPFSNVSLEGDVEYSDKRSLSQSERFIDLDRMNRALGIDKYTPLIVNDVHQIDAEILKARGEINRPMLLNFRIKMNKYNAYKYIGIVVKLVILTIILLKCLADILQACGVHIEKHWGWNFDNLVISIADGLILVLGVHTICDVLIFNVIRCIFNILIAIVKACIPEQSRDKFFHALERKIQALADGIDDVKHRMKSSVLRGSVKSDICTKFTRSRVAALQLDDSNAHEMKAIQSLKIASQSQVNIKDRIKYHFCGSPVSKSETSDVHEQYARVLMTRRRNSRDVIRNYELEKCIGACHRSNISADSFNMQQEELCHYAQSQNKTKIYREYVNSIITGEQDRSNSVRTIRSHVQSGSGAAMQQHGRDVRFAETKDDQYGFCNVLGIRKHDELKSRPESERLIIVKQDAVKFLIDRLDVINPKFLLKLASPLGENDDIRHIKMLQPMLWDCAHVLGSLTHQGADGVSMYLDSASVRTTMVAEGMFAQYIKDALAITLAHELMQKGRGAKLSQGLMDAIFAFCLINPQIGALEVSEHAEAVIHQMGVRMGCVSILGECGSFLKDFVHEYVASPGQMVIPAVVIAACSHIPGLNVVANTITGIPDSVMEGIGLHSLLVAPFTKNPIVKNVFWKGFSHIDMPNDVAVMMMDGVRTITSTKTPVEHIRSALECVFKLLNTILSIIMRILCISLILTIWKYGSCAPIIDKSKTIINTKEPSTIIDDSSDVAMLNPLRCHKMTSYV